MTFHNLIPTRTKQALWRLSYWKAFCSKPMTYFSFPLYAYFSDANSPVHVTKEALQLYQTQFTARWEGLIGDDHIPR